jgi:hypothetical protein
VLALLEPSAVVDDPRIDRRTSGHLGEGIVGGDPPNVAIAPLHIGQEMQEPLMCGVGRLGISTSASGDRLDALALAIPEQSQGIGGK